MSSLISSVELAKSSLDKAATRLAAVIKSMDNVSLRDYASDDWFSEADTIVSFLEFLSRQADDLLADLRDHGVSFSCIEYEDDIQDFMDSEGISVENLSSFFVSGIPFEDLLDDLAEMAIEEWRAGIESQFSDSDDLPIHELKDLPPFVAQLADVFGDIIGLRFASASKHALKGVAGLHMLSHFAEFLYAKRW